MLATGSGSALALTGTSTQTAIDNDTRTQAAIDKTAESQVNPIRENKKAGKKRHGKRSPGLHLAFKSAAETLGLSFEELKEQLPGKSLADIAQEQNVPVANLKSAITAALESGLEEQVASGKISAEKAEELRGQIAERVIRIIDRENKKAGKKRPHEGTLKSKHDRNHTLDA